MKTAKAKVYFEYQPETEKYDEELQFDPEYNENCLLSYEWDNIGVQKEWFEGMDLSKYETGNYEVEYEWDTDAEYCDGYKMYDYPYVVRIVSMKFLDPR